MKEVTFFSKPKVYSEQASEGTRVPKGCVMRGETVVCIWIDQTTTPTWAGWAVEVYKFGVVPGGGCSRAPCYSLPGSSYHMPPYLWFLVIGVLPVHDTQSILRLRAVIPFSARDMCSYLREYHKPSVPLTSVFPLLAARQRKRKTS